MTDRLRAGIGVVRRIGFLTVGVVLIVMVGLVAFRGSGRTDSGQAVTHGTETGGTETGGKGGGQAPSCAPNRPLTAVRGLIGSEKQAFFDDARVRREFACIGLELTIDIAGSREMPSALNRSEYNFAFPSSAPTAQKIMEKRRITERYTPFSSPMAVATFRPIVDVLTRAGIIQTTTDGSPVLDIATLLDVARNGTRWDQLPGNVEYPVRKAVLLSTTDPRDSNSAIMYLAIASHVANGNAVVTSEEQLRQVVPTLCSLVLGQGAKPPTSQLLFNQYLADGMARTPAALIYEAQFAATAPGQKPNIDNDRILLYPRPTVYSQHTLVPLDAAGNMVGQALRDNPKLAQLAAEHGFRPERPTSGPVSSRPSPVDVIEPPSFEILERMLRAFEPGGWCIG